MTTSTAGTVRPRKRIARGPQRPKYLESRDLDRMMIMFLALMAEVSSLRDRLEAHEALAAQGNLPAAEAVEGLPLTTARGERREQDRAQMIHRVFRVLNEDSEASS